MKLPGAELRIARQVSHPIVSRVYDIGDVLLIMYLHVRAQRRKFSGHFERFIDDELDRLNTERTRTPQHWASLAPDEKMKALDEDIAKAQSRLAELAQHGQQDRTERRRLLRMLSHLREQRTDVLQRQRTITSFQPGLNLGKRFPMRERIAGGYTIGPCRTIRLALP